MKKNEIAGLSGRDFVFGETGDFFIAVFLPANEQSLGETADAKRKQVILKAFGLENL